MPKRFGMLVVQSNDEIEAERERQLRVVEEAGSEERVITELASYVRRCWEAARQAKTQIEDTMLKCLRQRRGIYDPEKLQAIRAAGGGAEIYMLLTEEKCNAAESWIEDILLQPGREPWGMSATEIPELPPQMVQQIHASITAQVAQEIAYGAIADEGQVEARIKELLGQTREEIKRRAKDLEDSTERRIADVLQEARWRDELVKVIGDIVTFPAGFLACPIVRVRRTLEWDQETGEPIVIRRPRLEIQHISPFDVYPAPMSRDVGDGYIIVRWVLARRSLHSMIGSPGYDDDEIRSVLIEYPNGYNSRHSLDAARSQLEDRDNEHLDPEGRYEALQFWGSIQGKMLLEWGLSEEQIPDPTDEYPAEVWLIDRHVIRAQLNPDPLGRPPIHKASFREVPGSFWGMGIPQLLTDIQDAANATARSLLNNMSISSGPQVGVDVSALPPGEDITSVYPWKIWQVDRSQYLGGLQGRDPVWFFQPHSNASELLRVYEYFSNEADNKTGIPKYSYGGTGGSGGAASTATGFSMMMSNATKAIKRVIRNIDTGIIEPSVQRIYEWLLLNDPSPDLRGDIKIYAKGSSELLIKEAQQLRRNELLSIVLNSEVLLGLIGEETVLDLFRSIVSSMDISLDLPTRQEIEAKRQQQVMALLAAQAQPQGQAPPPSLSSPPPTPGQPGGSPPGTPSDLSAEVGPDGSVRGGTDYRTATPRRRFLRQ